MPKPSEKERLEGWQSKVNASNKVYEEWENEYFPDVLEKYYYGHQWQGDEQSLSKRKYVINLFYPSINISKPSMLYQLPKYKVTPRLTRIDDPKSDAAARAKLHENTLNSFVQTPDLGFEMETGLAILDAQFRFGVVQVGYTADFIDNPNAGKPMLSETEVELEDGTKARPPMLGKDGNPVLEANVTIESEGLFLKWIPGKQFRVSRRSANRFSACDWVGYYEWHYTDDLKANKRYKNTKELKATGKYKGDSEPPRDDQDAQPGMVKVWFLWDIRGKMRRIFPQGGEKFFLEESFKFLPFAVLKFDEILGQFLPLPPTYNWVHPQNELNDTREMQRVHRKRMVRRYEHQTGSVEVEELAKLEENEDGTIIKTNKQGPCIIPIQDAPLDPAITRNIQLTQEDFTRISGISGESQQVADSETATQANLIALSAKVRESSKRLVVALWLAAIGRIMLLTLRDNMALPFWIKKAVDPASPLAMAEAQEVAMLWQQITSEELGDIDADISVDLSSMSPVAQEQELQKWLTFLSVVTNPTTGMVLSQSPALLRKTAGLFDIHNERDIVEVGNALAAVAQAAALQAAMKGTPGLAAPGAIPSNGAIQGQIAQQLPTEVTVQ